MSRITTLKYLLRILISIPVGIVSLLIIYVYSFICGLGELILNKDMSKYPSELADMFERYLI